CDQPCGQGLLDLPHPQPMRGRLLPRVLRPLRRSAVPDLSLLRSDAGVGGFRHRNLYGDPPEEPALLQKTPEHSECPAMKHMKPMNMKAHQVEVAMAKGDTQEVVAMAAVGGCSTTVDPGW